VDVVGVLESILSKDVALIRGVHHDQWEDTTPCPQYTVRDLVTHMSSWIRVFAAAATGTVFEGDPASYQLGDDAPGAFAANAEQLVSGWRRLGTERPVRLTGGEMPGGMVFNMTLMEYLTHGWDLARATGQPQPFSDEEATESMTRATATLPDQYRGDDQAFGHIVPVRDDAPVLDRFAGFMGRQP
jgi:uncharacterized protein (TIGR03086 family)